MLNIEELREYCLLKQGVTESFPFDKQTLVFKVMNKMFALTPLDKPFSVNLKCEPEKALLLREKHRAVTPGYHMNKKHWNTVIIDGSIPKAELLAMIDDSYKLVVQTLKKSDQARLERLSLKR